MMNWLRNFSIKAKLTLITMVVSVTAVLIV